MLSDLIGTTDWIHALYQNIPLHFSRIILPTQLTQNNGTFFDNGFCKALLCVCQYQANSYTNTKIHTMI